jgi:hypothetical protein
MQFLVDKTDKGDENMPRLKQQDRAGLFLCPVDVAKLLLMLLRGKNAPNQLRRDSVDEVWRC